MRTFLVPVTLLCLTTWMSSVHTTHGPMSGCCPMWSNTRVRLARITKYTVLSEGVCPIAATVFHTISGKRICSDPNNDWTKRTMTKVNKRDAVVSSKTATLQKKGRKGRRSFGRKNNRRGRKEAREAV